MGFKFGWVRRKGLGLIGFWFKMGLKFYNLINIYMIIINNQITIILILIITNTHNIYTIIIVIYYNGTINNTRIHAHI